MLHHLRSQICLIFKINIISTSTLHLLFIFCFIIKFEKINLSTVTLTLSNIWSIWFVLLARAISSMNNVKTHYCLLVSIICISLITSGCKQSCSKPHLPHTIGTKYCDVGLLACSFHSLSKETYSFMAQNYRVPLDCIVTCILELYTFV